MGAMVGGGPSPAASRGGRRRSRACVRNTPCSTARRGPPHPRPADRPRRRSDGASRARPHIAGVAATASWERPVGRTRRHPARGAPNGPLAKGSWCHWRRHAIRRLRSHELHQVQFPGSAVAPTGTTGRSSRWVHAGQLWTSARTRSASPPHHLHGRPTTTAVLPLRTTRTTDSRRGSERRGLRPRAV